MTQVFEFIFAPETLAEVQFSTIVEPLGKLPIVGVIDRLVLSEDLACIIDFKTNREVPSCVDQVPLGILQQMGAYAASMQKVFTKKKYRIRNYLDPFSRVNENRCKLQL